jgi:hypothetical protein
MGERDKELIRAWARFALDKDDHLADIFETADAGELRALLCYLAGYFKDDKENLTYLALTGNKEA